MREEGIRLLGGKTEEPMITSADQVPAEIRREIEEKAGQQREEELISRGWKNPEQLKWLDDDLESARSSAEINWQRVEELEKELQEEQEYSYRLQEKLRGNETTKDKLPSPIVIGDKILTPKKRLGGGKYGEVYLADRAGKEAGQKDEVVLKVENLGLDDEEKQVFNRELETLVVLYMHQKSEFKLQETDIFTPPWFRRRSY